MNTIYLNRGFFFESFNQVQSETNIGIKVIVAQEISI